MQSSVHPLLAHNMPLILQDEDDFSLLQEKQGLYVDKTSHIHLLRTQKVKFAFLARPRRFGKSLFLSTLASYFRQERERFTNTFVQQQDVWSHPKHPVIHLNMTDVESNNASAIREALRDLVHSLYVDLQEEGWDLSPQGNGTATDMDPSVAPPMALGYVLRRLSANSDGKPVVLIDEYDAPITRLIGLERDDMHSGLSDLQGVLAVLHSFYQVLKSHGRYLEFVFITGVSCFVKTSLFSGLNNLRDLSHRHDFATLCGFTEYELDTTLAPYLELAARETGWPLSQCKPRLQAEYNGYRFAQDAPHVYNPFSLLCCLDSMYDAGNAFDREHLPHFWSESGNPQFLVRLVRSGRYDLNIAPTADWHTLMETTYNAEQPNWTALMVQTGYWSFKEAGGPETANSVLLDFANHEVRTTFNQFLLREFMDDLPPLLQALQDINDMYKSLQCRDYEDFRERVHRVFAGIAYDHLTSEHCYHAVLMALGNLMQKPGQHERHGRKGRADIVLRFPDHVCLVELKHKQTVTAALAQIREREYGLADMGRGFPVIGLGLNFTEDNNTEVGYEVLYDPVA